MEMEVERYDLACSFRERKETRRLSLGERRRKRQHAIYRLCHHAKELFSFSPCFRSLALILMSHPKGCPKDSLSPPLPMASYSAKLASNWDLAFGKKNKDKS